MTTTEAIREIHERGYELTEDTLRSMIRRNHVPRPRFDSSQRFDWTRSDIDGVCEVLDRRATKRQPVRNGTGQVHFTKHARAKS